MLHDRIMFAKMNFNVTDVTGKQGTITYYETTDITSEAATFGSNELMRVLDRPFVANHVFVVNYNKVESVRNKEVRQLTELSFSLSQIPQ